MNKDPMHSFLMKIDKDALDLNNNNGLLKLDAKSVGLTATVTYCRLPPILVVVAKLTGRSELHSPAGYQSTC